MLCHLCLLMPQCHHGRSLVGGIGEANDSSHGVLEQCTSHLTLHCPPQASMFSNPGSQGTASHE